MRARATQWAFASMSGSPGARAYYDALRARGKNHGAALRQLGNRWVGILHGCLKTHTPYDEHTAWPSTVPVDSSTPSPRTVPTPAAA